MSARLAIVTATIDYPRAEACIESWLQLANKPVDLYVVGQGRGYREWEVVQRRPGGAATFGFMHRDVLGVVPAYAIGVKQALHDGAQIIACFHDDLLIEYKGWDDEVTHLFKACPPAGLCGFGGAKGFGSDDIYQTPYQPMQLARQSFRSNMRHAEAHGVRAQLSEPVACLDGFSQIGRREFWLGHYRDPTLTPVLLPGLLPLQEEDHGRNLFHLMASKGIIHHAYDGALGAFARVLGYKVWFIPVACHHYGGVTAVTDDRYHLWADAQATPGFEEGTGDQRFWLQSHKAVYEMFRGVLPIRT